MGSVSATGVLESPAAEAEEQRAQQALMDEPPPSVDQVRKQQCAEWGAYDDEMKKARAAIEEDVRPKPQ